MEKEFKKVFFGYDIEEVDKRLLDLEQEYEKIYEDYQQELTRLKNQKVDFESEITRLKSEMVEYNDFNEKLSSILTDSYFKSSEVVFNTKAKLDEKIKEKNLELDELQSKNTEIKNSVNSLLSKLENIVIEKKGM
jgi:cell division initiation protein